MDCAIKCGSTLANIIAYDEADIGAGGYTAPVVPGFIPGIAAEL